MLTSAAVTMGRGGDGHDARGLGGGAHESVPQPDASSRDCGGTCPLADLRRSLGPECLALPAREGGVRCAAVTAAALCRLVPARHGRVRTPGATAAPGIAELLAALYRYVKGDLSRAFNRQTTFSHRSVPLVVFGLSKVPTELKRVRMRQLQHYVWSQHVDKSKRTIEFLDEAWHFLSNPETAKDLADRIVRLRKYGGAVVMATQQVDDYLKNDEARRATSQASVRIIMKQRDESVNTVGDLYGLTDQERRTVRTLRHGEYLMLSGGFRSLIAKVVPAERLALYDTRADAQPAQVQVAQDTAGGGR